MLYVDYFRNIDRNFHPDFSTTSCLHCSWLPVEHLQKAKW